MRDILDYFTNLGIATFFIIQMKTIMRHFNMYMEIVHNYIFEKDYNFFFSIQNDRI